MTVSPDFARALPKAEVHVHLEGCFEPGDLESLLGEDGATAGVTDLRGFLGLLDQACGSVRTAEQVASLARRFVWREAQAGVRYADLLVSPVHWPAWHGRLSAFVDAIDGGLQEAEQDGGPPVGLCVSLSRHASASEAREFVETLLAIRHPRVVALSIDGNEAVTGRTGPRFAEAFKVAAQGGLRRTVHAGESSGPEGVRDAIGFLGAERIDHGVRAIEDPSLVQELADRGIPLNVCPHSNVLLGLYPSRAGHPIDMLRQAGVRVSVNTDDPGIFGCRLDEEYAANAATFHWDQEVVRQLARTSIEASFADQETKAALLRELETHSAPRR
jgi:adenosine deaminase